MKRIACMLAILLVLTACGQDSPPEPEEESSVVEVSRQESSGNAEPIPVDEGLIADRFLRHLADEDYEAAFELCGSEMQAAVASAEGTQAMWAQILGLAGVYQSHEEPQEKDGVFYFPANFEGGRYLLQVAEQEGLVTGFYIWQGLGLAEQYVDAFFDGNDETVFSLSDENMQEFYDSVDGVTATRQQMVLSTGNYLSRENPIATASGEYVSFVFPALCEEGSFDLHVSVINGEKVAGFGILNSADSNANALALRDGPTPSDDLPAGVAEEDIFINQGGETALHGKLTYPEDVTEPIPVVVLVQGSGAHDMDETISGNKPFKDIAYALSRQGIAVLRYNKVTYAYPAAFTNEAITIDQETVDDAVAAKTALTEQSALEFSAFYVAGHSLGGMMAPRIATTGGYDGMVILAGSPRNLVDIGYDQAQYLVPISEAMTDEQKKFALDDYKRLYEESKTMWDIPVEELAEQTMMGFPAVYIRSMEEPDRTEALLAFEGPILILQGGKDFQVYADKDFAAYQQLTAGRENVECILYEELNHLFMTSFMETPDTTEYATLANVDSRVTDDIARWIAEQHKP